MASRAFVMKRGGEVKAEPAAMASYAWIQTWQGGEGGKATGEVYRIWQLMVGGLTTICRWGPDLLKGGTHGATGPVIICVIIEEVDQPPLVPPVDKEGRQVHVQRVGKDGERGEGGRGGEGARKGTVGERERAGPARMSSRAWLDMGGSCSWTREKEYGETNHNGKPGRDGE